MKDLNFKVKSEKISNQINIGKQHIWFSYIIDISKNEKKIVKENKIVIGE